MGTMDVVLTTDHVVEVAAEEDGEDVAVEDHSVPEASATQWLAASVH